MCATAICNPVESAVAELALTFNSMDHWVINSPLAQKCSDKLPVVVSVNNVDDEENEVWIKRPSMESIIPTSIRFDSASAEGIAGIISNARRTAIAFLMVYAKSR